MEQTGKPDLVPPLEVNDTSDANQGDVRPKECQNVASDKSEQASPEVNSLNKADASNLEKDKETDVTSPIKLELKTPLTIPKRDAITIERCNLLNVCHLVIKELIDSSLKHGRMLDEEHVPLQQFFVILEHVLRHGIRPKKGILRDKRDFWCVLETIEKYIPEAFDITTSVKEMPNVKSPVGRARAWLRLALMQKKLADYFKFLVDKKDEILKEFYESSAIMLGDEAAMISGLLVGLNVIDCNIAIKDEDLDQPLGVIDFSLYLKNAKSLEERIDQTPTDRSNSIEITTILDQKNYLEELNRHLNATVTNLQNKVETLTTNNALMREDLAVAQDTIAQLQKENSELNNEKTTLLETTERQIKNVQDDIDTERATYETSRSSLDSMYNDTKKLLAEEVQTRLDLEKELSLQISMKQEMEVALRLLEKDVHEKQDTVISLRKQLEDIKQINIDIYQQLQEKEKTLSFKSDMVTRLEEKSLQMTETMNEMDKKMKQHLNDKKAAEETCRKLGQNLADRDIKRSALETDLKIEREWRASLQQNLDQEKSNVHAAQTQLSNYNKIEKDYKELEKKYAELEKICEDSDLTLSELGSHLRDSKIQFEDLKESQDSMREAHWADDKDVSNCKNCQKTFSVARRKHHCRNCGFIFCKECSDNKVSLASSAKPVRVCDTCHEFLLQRHSAPPN